VPAAQDLLEEAEEHLDRPAVLVQERDHRRRPAEVVAFLYQYRWTIEVFFRFLKQVLGCRHLLSTRREGFDIQVYAAVICCLMLNQLTGRKPTKWMVTLMAFYLQGLATEADVLKELNKPDNAGVKLRAKDALWKKLGY